ncbi:alpha-ketoacid dehydrogenase subunit beta [Ilyobacter polytropus]|uniref:Transketolase central region n=1 Tax=Ilyobacter polytropus (strain ATCC 51220 / DSM 2926 / LMG 16218 / CuHBu1) TaxID=572544 RepID=E3HAC9_ILYPC|nr:alpha-ketoacid dehydrogenase subunit beta [Ilyobacter polytropus]ADO83659.1 Transketolase central region [Ilyobacter polytropus DSM 2926]
MAVLNNIEALNQSLMQMMETDDTIIVFGEDSGFEGGVFRVTKGLQEKFGKERCFDTPLTEAGIVGSGIGMAITGLKPVAEIQFQGFVFPAMNQIMIHAARMRNRSRGRFTVPMVIRMPYGGAVRALEHHSESIEALFAHIPGLKVVIPSNPYDTKGLMISAIKDPDPVIFLEPKRLYRAFKQEIPDEIYEVPIGKARVLQEGEDITVVAWGAMIPECQKAITMLKENNVSVDLIDLRTISPIDKETISQSVKKTGRFLVVHEAVKSFGAGAELISIVNEKAFLSLEAPPSRLTGFDVTVPLAKGEHHFIVNPEKIKNKIMELINF